MVELLFVFAIVIILGLAYWMGKGNIAQVENDQEVADRLTNIWRPEEQDPGQGVRGEETK